MPLPLKYGLSNQVRSECYLACHVFFKVPSIVYAHKVRLNVGYWKKMFGDLPSSIVGRVGMRLHKNFKSFLAPIVYFSF